jgi:hypothetical protein
VEAVITLEGDCRGDGRGRATLVRSALHGVSSPMTDLPVPERGG